MTTATLPPPELDSLSELRARLGDIPATRLRSRPTPGTATEADLLEINDGEKDALCELAEGTLVDKPVGAEESLLALGLGGILRAFVKARRLGLAYGPDAPLRLGPGLIRLPDLTFVSWNQLPGRRRPRTPIANVPPTLAVEVLSASNTRAEMARKRQEYFAAGGRQVWIVDPVARTIAVYTSPTEHRLLTESDTLDGGDVLPGFTLPLADLFADLDEEAPDAGT